MTEADLDELRSELDDFAQPQKVSGSSAQEQRVIAGYEEIERFVDENGRLPLHGENRDIFERLYAVRLDRMRSSEECRVVLRERDSRGLLNLVPGADDGRVRESSVEYHARAPSEVIPSDEELVATLSGEYNRANDITDLKHVRSREEINAAEEVAQRNPCKDFGEFRPIFESVQHQVNTGERHTFKYQDNAEICKGDFFVLNGQTVYVAELGDSFTSEYGRPDRRLRVIYDNGTESDLLLRSLQRALNKDEASRRVTDPGFGPLFSDSEEEDDLPSGFIYVLRSKSDHPFIAENRTVIHKIGVTGGDVTRRIASAQKDPTFLLAAVEIVGGYKLANVSRSRLEALIHRFFAGARLDLELKDRFGSQVEPKEWFLVSLPVIEEAIQKFRDGTIGDYRYDPTTARIVKRETNP